MPIGTQSTAILLKNYSPKITRQPKSKQELNFWNLLLETIILTVVATAAGALTGGIASTAILSLGATDLAAGIGSFAVRTLVGFSIDQIFDTMKNQVTPKTTILNLLLQVGFNANKVSRGYRTTKILRLAKDTKTLQKLGVDEVKNIQDVIKQLSNTSLLTKDINNKKQLFKFGKLNREQVLQEIGFVTQENFKFNFKNLSMAEIKQNLSLQENLLKLSPKLIPTAKINSLDQVNNFLKKFGTDYETVVKMKQVDWFNFIAQLQKSNRGKSLVLTLQQIRSEGKKYNLISKGLDYVNKRFKYLNPNYYVNAALTKAWKSKKNIPVFSQVKAKIQLLEKRISAIEEKVFSRIKNLKLKGKDFFSKAEKYAINQFNLIPLTSPVFLACKIDPIGFNQVVITIFYRDSRYDPIVVTDTLDKAEDLIDAEHPFSWYWHESGWALGYGINKHSINTLVALLPDTARQITQEGLRINFQIRKLMKKLSLLENNKLINFSVKKALFITPVNFAARKLFKTKTTRLLIPIINKTFNNNPINFKRNIRTRGISSSARYIKRKIRKRII